MLKIIGDRFADSTFDRGVYMKKINLMLIASVMVLSLGAQTLPQGLRSPELTILNSETGERFLVKELNHEILERWFGIKGVIQEGTDCVVEYKFNIRKNNNPMFIVVDLNPKNSDIDTSWRDLPQLKLYIPGIEQPISTGMTEAEIVTILGQPPKKSGNIYFHYEGYGITRNFRISFEKQPSGPARVLDIHF